MRVCALDVEYHCSGFINGYGLATDRGDRFTVQTVSDELNKVCMYPIVDPDYDHSEHEWDEWLLHYLEDFDVVLGFNVNNDLSKFQRYPELYKVLDRKYRDMGWAMGQLFGLKTKHKTPHRKMMGLADATKYLAIDNSNHHKPDHDAEVALLCLYRYPFTLNYLRPNPPKTKCGKCGGYYVQIFEHRKKYCKGVKPEFVEVSSSYQD